MKQIATAKRGFGAINTKEKKEIFLAVFKLQNCNITKACEAVPIGRRTFYNWVENSKKFREAIQDLQESNIDWAEGKLRELIEGKDTIATIFYLKTRGKHRGYIEKQEVQASGNIDHKLIIEIVKTKDENPS